MNKKKLIFVCSLAVTMLAMGGATNAGTRQVSAAGETQTVTINFGTTAGYVSLDAETGTFTDSNNISWNWDVTGTTSFTKKPSYSQIGSSSKPASTISLASGSLENGLIIKSYSMKLGGFTGTAGNVAISIGESTASGNLNASTDVTVSNATANYTTVGDANFDINISGIAKGVKLYSFTYTYSTEPASEDSWYVSFDAQNGTDATEVEVTKGQTIGEDKMPAEPIKDGYSFGGWYTDEVCTAGNEFGATTAITANMTVYAKWVDLEVTTIANVKTQTEGTFFRVTGEVVTKQNASTAIIQDSTGGIVLSTSGAFNAIEVGNTITVTGKYTIYKGAQELTELKSVVVNSNDTTVEVTPVTEVTTENFGKYVELTNLKIASVSAKSPYTVTLEGIENYVLFFSSVAEAGFDTTTMTVGKYINVKGAITIFDTTLEVIPHSVTLVQTCTVTFSTGEGASVASQEVIEGGKVTKPADPEGYTKDGYRYTFKQWLLDGVAFDFDTEVTSNITLTAEWTETKIPTAELFADVNTQASLKLSYEKTTEAGEVAEEVSASTNTYLPDGLDAEDNFSGKVVYDEEASNYMGSSIYYLEANVGYIDYSLEDIKAGYFLVGGYLNIARTADATAENPVIKYYVEVVASDGTISKSLENVVTYKSNYEYEYIDEAFDEADLVGAKALRLRYTVDQEADKYYAYYEFSVEGEAKKAATVDAYKNFSNISMQFRYQSDLVNNEDVLENGLFIMNDTNGFTTDGTLPTTGTKHENTTGTNTLTIALDDIALASCKGKIYVAAYVKDESGYHFGKVRELSVSSMITTYLSMTDEEVTPEAKAILTALQAEINK